MIGRVTGTPEAILTLSVHGPHGDPLRIDAILDTGFTDYLTLPQDVIRKLGLPPLDTAQCQLADGRIVTMQSYQVTVDWYGAPREVLALAADGEPLVGMSMLYGSTLTMDVLPGREFRLKPIRPLPRDGV
jgi:clan AA aspartic protease